MRALHPLAKNIFTTDTFPPVALPSLQRPSWSLTHPNVTLEKPLSHAERSVSKRDNSDNSGCCFLPITRTDTLHSDSELRHHRLVRSVAETRGDGGHGRLPGLHLGRPWQPAGIDLLRQGLGSTVLPLESSLLLLAGNALLR